MYDLIVIGGGPAGLTAAIYAIRKRLNVLLILKGSGWQNKLSPGRCRIRIVTWSFAALKLWTSSRANSSISTLPDAWRRFEKVVKQDDHFVVHLAGDVELETKAVIVATGTRQQFLDVPGEREYLSRGLCYSAISYAPLFIDKKAVVIGSGDLALRSAAELSTVAEHVHLVGATGAVLDTPLGQMVKGSPNVTVLEGYEVTRVLGNGYAERVVVRDPDGVEMDIPADGTFVEKALQANSQMVADLVETNEEGFIIVDCQCRTNVPGVFSAGDVTHIMAEQVLVAVGEGVKAALSAYEYLLPRL